MAEERTIHIFEEGYKKKVDDGKAPATFGYKNVKEYDDNYADLVENFEYALVNLIGEIMTSDESEIAYAWLISWVIYVLFYYSNHFIYIASESTMMVWVLAGGTYPNYP